MKKKICVVGAGVAGLACLRHLTAPAATNDGFVPNFDVVAFEQSSGLGGIWVYTPDASGPQPNPMYRDMRTNLPKEIMCYPDFPCSTTSTGDDSFMHHSTVLQYLQEYTTNFGLEKFIQFRKRVQLVNPIFADNDSTRGEVLKWEVTVEDLSHDPPLVQVYEFEYVMVCNGHFTRPHLPAIPGLSGFRGQAIHSQAYRSRDEYAGKRVMIVGYKFSAIDIALEITSVATEVVVSIRTGKRLTLELPDNVRQVGLIEAANETEFLCRRLPPGADADSFGAGEDNEFIAVDVDAIIFCTGYEYEFPFLSPACKMEIEANGKFVTPLYKELVHAKFPSLCFIGLQQLVIPFILVDTQVRYYLAYLDGMFQFPKDMLQLSNSSTLDKTHILGDKQWPYYDDLAAEAGIERDGDGGVYPCVFGSFVGPLHQRLTIRQRNSFIKRMSDAVGPRRTTVPDLFKNDRIQIQEVTNKTSEPETDTEGSGFLGLDFIYIKYER